jgi:hypothetical protein
MQALSLFVKVYGSTVSTSETHWPLQSVLEQALPSASENMLLQSTLNRFVSAQ